MVAKPVDIEELERLEKAATPGPFAWSYIGEKSNGWVMGTGETTRGEILSGGPIDPDDLVNPVIVGSNEETVCNYADPALLCAARNALRALIQEVRELRRIVRAMATEIEVQDQKLGHPFNSIVIEARRLGLLEEK